MVIAFLLPFKLFVPTCSFLAVICWLLSGGVRAFFEKKHQRFYVFLFVGYFLLHLTALFYTSNFECGVTNLEIKLTLFFFPFLFHSMHLDKKLLKMVVYAFVLSCALSSVGCLLMASVDYYKTKETAAFFYERLSWFVHPSYYTMYLTLSVLFLLADLYFISNSNQMKVIKIGTVLFFVFVAVLCASKMGLMSMLFCVVLFAVYVLLNMKKYFVILFFVVGIVLLGAVLLKSFPRSFDRFNSIFKATELAQIDKRTAESSGVRRLIWNASGQIISEDLLLGVAPGDVNDKLYKKYEELGYEGALKHKLNAHNEFVQTFIGLGIIGFVVLLLQFVLPGIVMFKEKNILYLLFLTLLFVNFLVESMLQTQAGNIFYAFFNSILFFNPNFIRVLRDKEIKQV